MNTQFQYQISEYDCVPITFINAIVQLFDRKEVPPIVLQHIYLYSLDTVTRGNRLGRAGTSKFAVQLLGNWLASYRTKNFSVATKFLRQDTIHMKPKSRIIRALQTDGVALCNIHLGRGEWHFILALEIKGNRVLFFDPYYRTSVRGLRGVVEVLAENGKPRSPNLAIDIDWFDRTDERSRFCMGPVDMRECLLMWKNR
ncbi:MAG: hypothetical protein KJ970_17615 [Candidatus Eisenbacteria bacterium]|uniref:Peptidase C39-like domain-containing protein n=1 Tax=Eiseniibacteriota bacterium TaxID=2212470 RepID=A0A948WEG0_UNCEI|nr:hypothetical protein [Candidatus Eisenbacteria bacterium]MBU1949670.1 hypothetical protein [Candidatus Eisenbacteria bacterium]MBU2692738.1 hypothetical protein [Candidatus Eisenbacteria bacterium]